MRRILSLMAAGLLGAAAGCCHTGGSCDCDPPGHPANCHYYSGAHGCAPAGGVPCAHAEPIKEMPRPTDQGAVPPRKEVRQPAEQGTLPAALDDVTRQSKQGLAK